MDIASISLFVFYISLGLLFYTYIGYGLLAAFLGAFRSSGKHSNKDITTTKVSVIIPAYNEAGVLQQKVSNTIHALQNFQQWQMIVITDGSNDGSANLVFDHPSILHLHQNERMGKSAAINKSMLHVTGEIVIITDSNAMVNDIAFEKLVSKFDHEKTGAVSGEKKVQYSDGSVGGEGVYWKYESFLKKCSAKMYSLTGAAGELIAIRKNVFKPIAADSILDDLQLSLDIIRQNKIISYEPMAFALEPPSKSLSDEFQRKVRISAGVFQTLRRNLFVFNPFKHSVFVFQFFSHRILRWIISIPSLFILLATNIFICLYTPPEWELLFCFQVLFVLQLIFYLLVIIGYLLRNVKLPSIFFLPFYFIMMNSAVLVGFFRYLRNKESVMWKKAAR